MTDESAALFVTIFVGAFLDAAPIAGFFVFGEAFFLLAGGAAYSTGSPLPVVAAYAGAWASDQTGFVIGRWMRPAARRLLLRRLARRRIVRKAERWLRRGGVFAIAATRFMGPVAWVTPLISGSLSLRYRVFALGSAIGVTLGVGQFLLAGWLGAYALTHGAGVDVAGFVKAHGLTLALVGQAVFILAVLVWVLIRRSGQTASLPQE